MDELKQYLDLIIVACLVLALVFYDVTLDLCLGLLHFVLERLHELFEWFELALEHSIEHVFHTSHHGAQIATFYVLLAMFAFGAYRLWTALPRIWRCLELYIRESWARRKTQMELYWLSRTLTHKIFLIGTALGVAYVASFFVM